MPSRTDDALMARVGRLPRLTELRLGGNPAVTGAGLAKIRGLSRLRILDLSGTAIDGPSLVDLRGMTALEELSLPDDVSDADVAHIAGLTSLWRLSLGGPKITDAGLAHLVGLTRLNDLTIRCPGVRGPGLDAPPADPVEARQHSNPGRSPACRRASRALPPRPALLHPLSLRREPRSATPASGPAPRTSLDLHRPPPRPMAASATPASLRSLALANLQELSLDGTRITDAGLAAFARARTSNFGWRDPISTFDVARTAITDASLPVLRSMRRVGGFDLTGTAVTPAGLAAFKASLPAGWYEVRP